MKKVLSILVALVMVLALVPAVTMAASTTIDAIFPLILDGTSSGEEFTITGTVVVPQDGSGNAHIVDPITKVGICVRFKDGYTTANTLAMGDVVTVTGKSAKFNGLPQLEQADLDSKTDGTPIAPTMIALADYENNLSKYIRIENATIKSLDLGYATVTMVITDGTKDLQCRTGAVTATFTGKVGDTVSLNGVPTVSGTSWILRQKQVDGGEITIIPGAGNACGCTCAACGLACDGNKCDVGCACTCTHPVPPPQPVAKWVFTGSPNSETGLVTITKTPPTLANPTIAGNANLNTAGSAFGGGKWSVGGTIGIVFDTTGFEGISIATTLRASGGGPRNIVVEVCNEEGNWIAVDVIDLRGVAQDSPYFVYTLDIDDDDAAGKALGADNAQFAIQFRIADDEANRVGETLSDTGTFYFMNSFEIFGEGGEDEPLWGDADENGVVNAADAAKILRTLVELTTMTPNGEKLAKVTGGATVSAADAARILRFLVDLVSDLTPPNLVK